VKRLLVRIFIFLLLGAIVNIAVAWGSTLSLRHRSHVMHTWTDDAAVAAVISELGWDNDLWRPLPHIEQRWHGAAEKEVMIHIPRRGDIQPTAVTAMRSTECGWPVRALYGRIIWPRDAYEEWLSQGGNSQWNTTWSGACRTRRA
jgi:hypothetical protein